MFFGLIVNGIVFLTSISPHREYIQMYPLPCVDLPANLLNSTFTIFPMDSLGCCRNNEGNTVICK